MFVVFGARGTAHYAGRKAKSELWVACRCAGVSAGNGSLPCGVAKEEGGGGLSGEACYGLGGGLAEIWKSERHWSKVW